MDLLRVIGHHRARLATPVRTLQKRYSDADLENIPYADSTFSGAGTVSNRPLLVIDSSYKVNADDKTKSRSARASVDQDNKTTARTKLDAKTDDKAGPIGVVADTKVRGSQDDSEVVDTKVMASNSDAIGNSKTAVPEVGENKPLKSNSNKANVEVPEMSSNSKVTGLVVDNSTQKDIHVKQSKDQTFKNTKPNIDPDNIVSSSSTNNTDKASGLPTKQQGERKHGAPSRPVLEENIVLGVALEGSKRILPIDEEIDTDTAQEAKEMATYQGGNGSPKAADGNGK